MFQRKLGVAEAQNQAYTVRSGVRVVLNMLPIVFVSLKSLAYRALVNAGGPAGRNWDGAAIAQGVI